MYAKQLTAVLDYVEQLNEVNTDKVAETCQVTGLKNVMRTDAPKNADEKMTSDIIENFPEKLDRFLKVKAVFSE